MILFDTKAEGSTMLGTLSCVAGQHSSVWARSGMCNYGLGPRFKFCVLTCCSFRRVVNRTYRGLR